MFTKHQSAYFAHWLTQSGKLQNQVSRVMASARVDMNPHQLEAACFALKSPIEKGVLLADEVGLGKTIEASLVIAQKWAEHKRKILLIVPASLRKQWNQELLDKFELHSTIVDSKIARDLKKKGITNPFEQNDQVIISSYEYVALQKSIVQLISWDLVVFDEAHKLRNVYQKKGSKRAKAIVEATQEAASRVLLSATPIQNNLMELYGLSQVIDPHFFGDEKSFKILYANRHKNKDALLDLKQRIKPLCHRTLRRQVQQEGGINFTNRYALTEDFTPTKEEWDLYQQLSEYLQAPDNQAINPQAKHLVSIGLRKILASSSFAVAETLKGMVQRLRDKQLLDEDTLADLEDSGDWRDTDFGEAKSLDSQKPDKLSLEIELLNSFYDLAAGIETNAKGEAQLKVLNKAMEMAESLGGQKKAVIFTESCRTQQYLNKLLSNNGYAGRTVVLNGSNADVDSQNIYKEWVQKHQNTARISGSKPADVKAALVEKFKSNEADILISTEAGGEGINLQFCSVLVNYDLPWNPQKVEQRIGRVHRYGQKNDVVVVNFVNRKNRADQRVFQLLNEKLKLFEGVFGASDEVLGGISSSIDIEQRIYQIYQKCRTDEEIEQQFDQLQEDMKEALEIREASARESLMFRFDRDVVATLKNTRDSSHDFLQDYERVLLDLAKAELPEAKIKTNHFFYDNCRFDLSWPLAQKYSSEFFRLQATEHLLAWDMVKRAKAHSLKATHLEFQYNQLVGHYAALKELAGESGELAVYNLTFSYNLGKTHSSELFVVAKTNAGIVLEQENAAHLLCVPAQEKLLEQSINEQLLAAKMDTLVEEQKLIKGSELDNYLEQESAKLERWAQDRRKALMETVDELEEQIRQFKKDARQLTSTKDKIEARKSLRKLERRRDDALTEYHRAKKGIEQEEDKLLDEVSAKLKLSCRLTQLFSARWTLKL